MQDFVHYAIDTNNYAESFHSHLKTFYLKLMRRQRVDILVYILTTKLLPDFQRDDTRVRLGYSQPALCKKEQESRKQSDGIPSDIMETMVRHDLADDGENRVRFLPLLTTTLD